MEMFQSSTVARFSIAIVISSLITSATFSPLVFHLTRSVPVVRARPQAAVVLPPSISGIYPDPEPCRGNCSWVHDPSIVYDDNKYWRFTTSGNIAISTSRFLQGPWKYQGALLHNGTSIHLRDDQDIWAPSIVKRDETWYCHYSVSFIGSQHSEIGVATSTSLSPGSWTDHGAIGLPQNSRYNLIDPFVFQESRDSPAYFTFGSYWSGIQQIEMNNHDELLAWGGDERDIRTIISNTTANFAVQEGAIVYKNEEFFYVFFSVGQCCRRDFELALPGDEYHIVVCRAERIIGPYFDRKGRNCLTQNGGTTVLASHGDMYAPGGQGVMLDPKSERTVVYYHYVKKSVGFEAGDFFFGFNYLDWRDGWPYVVSSSD
ncbi:arabinan endo-1,5-alpha-L-arabinosidase [Parastagonospora nodorum]|nr:arabinan endo-1,5-alpha-L-arabinosidase [Parastagonospora nodorum]KAH3996579.1 arabinan endo-1,5-alpha-L-arabinosidase [Parastagonospora nodorum]KAH4019134.1 arabinan endo-1,5-alpha-L-arabinosidase [Parastagonospora nodorum]KAH4052469.1 arabinan endo-1,5-alpha-L-arabinosidase [Parastagonospora nodorum]KAH4070686.1 arabinan endo-1,5-alpha-L-arabinosidase [Parastagonospora nodorum]